MILKEDQQSLGRHLANLNIRVYKRFETQLEKSKGRNDEPYTSLGTAF